MSETGALTIDYCGEVHVVGATDTFSFGRTADLIIDENPFMHRVTGRFHCEAGRWWVTNVGSKSQIEIYDRLTRSKSVLMPGTDQVLPGGEVIVRFSAGPTAYEFDVETDPTEVDRPEIAIGEDSTAVAQDVPLTETQLLLILALAEPVLRDPLSNAAVPHSKDAANRIGWTVKRFNRKLDNVCQKFDAAGVRGLKASSGGLARDRRQRLVDHSVATGVVDATMLDQLDGADEAS